MSITRIRFVNLGWQGLWVIDGTGTWHRLRTWQLPAGLPGWILDLDLAEFGLTVSAKHE